MLLLRLALRNLTRNVRRTVLSLAAVVAGVAVLILGHGFVGGLEENTIRAQVDTMSGHVTVRPKGYPTEGLAHPVDEMIQLRPRSIDFFKTAAPHWTTRVLFAPRVVHGPDSMRVRAIAYEPDRDPTVFPRSAWKVDGKIPMKAEDGVLVSRGVSRLLDLHPGDHFIVEARTHKGAVNALDLPVAGVVSVGSPLIDRFGVLMTRSLGDQLMGGSPMLVTHVHVRLEDRDQTSMFVHNARAWLGDDLDIVTWQEETAAMLQLHQVRRKALDILVFALLLMSAAGIANTVLMAAYERVREVGTLRAMGMTRADVVRLFLYEGALMGALGSVIGAAIGGGVVKYYNINGIDLTAALDSASGGNMPVSSMLYLEFSLPMIGVAMGFGLVVSVLASIYPANVASAMAPADAVRG